MLMKTEKRRHAGNVFSHFMCIFMVFILVWMALPNRFNRSASAEPADAADFLQSIEEIRNANVGDWITLGSYEQDNDTTNGKENIQWLVVAKEDDKLLITSRYALDCVPYNDSKLEVTWESCSLNTWLNEAFQDEAFTPEEQALIVPAPEDNGSVFLFSISEVNHYFSSDEARRCAPTPYAKAKGVSTNADYPTQSGEASCWWWLRSPGSSHFTSAFVVNAGTIYCGGDYVRYDGEAVRPALWISISG